MRSADGIEHIIRFVMGRTVQPEFSHRKVYFLIMQQTVAYHSRRHTFCRELAIIFFGTIRQHLIEYIHYQFSDSRTDISQNLFATSGTLHRNACQQRQIRQQVIPATCTELLCKTITPILTATLPTVYVHVFQYPTCHLRMSLHKSLCKPVVKLFPDCPRIELIAFQSFSSSACCIGMSGSGMSHPQQFPFPFRENSCDYFLFRMTSRGILILFRQINNL